MEIQKVKISDLPVTEDLNGLKTLGTTAENTSKAAELTFIADAATSANEAATNANQAAENANTSAANADAKAEAAQKAADNATASANQADKAAVNANTATTRATAAAEKAENAADVAIGVVNEAQQATANANQAAQSANKAATNANQAATSANDAATEAHTQAEYAKTQGDYAKAEGDRVLAEKGQPGGLAELDESGRVPSSQLPSYVDDVINVANYSQLPNPGESGKIYITEDTNLTYRWSGTGYAEISPSLALGTTAKTAGRGDWTQAAYNHSLIKDGSNPHKTTFASLPDKPTSLPASDVYPWAKAASKPTYTAAEVGALALSGGTLTGNVITIGSFILANSGAYPQLTFRATADNSERLLFRHGNDLKWRYNGTNDGIIYHSGNLGNATTSKSGLMSAADKTKLDGLSGGGLNIPASGEVAISGWTYNGKQVYAQRWAGDTSTGAVVSGRNTSKTLASANASQLIMQGGTFYLSGDIANTFTVLGSQRWAASGPSVINSRLDFNVEDGTFTLKFYSTTSGVFVYDIWAAYTK